MDEIIKILIVDDNAAARSILKRILLQDSTMKIVGEAGTGAEGVLMLPDLTPDIVMLEANLNEGVALEEALKEIKLQNPETKVILCAERTVGEDIVLFADKGASNLVFKPYIKANILRVIKEVYAS